MATGSGDGVAPDDGDADKNTSNACLYLAGLPAPLTPRILLTKVRPQIFRELAFWGFSICPLVQDLAKTTHISVVAHEGLPPNSVLSVRPSAGKDPRATSPTTRPQCQRK